VTPERADAVVVGARPAGCATAIALARGGRTVVALDRGHFPSDTLSTHLLFAGGVAAIARLGALDRVERLGAPPLPEALMGAAGHSVRGRYTPVDGIAHGLCVRRTGLDSALVDTAREAGVDVRERSRVTELVHRDGRVAGVRYEDADGRERVVEAPLVVGADGRRSTIARLVGADAPYRSNANGRACFYAYLEDPHGEWRHIAAQWREGAELGTAFPCDGDLLLVLLMPPVARAHEFKGRLEDEWERTARSLTGLAERLAGCRRVTKVRSALDTTSYFRRSSGPGWALPGDAGHFKDPVTAQGIRDALHYGRLLGEAAAPVLEDPHALDAALRRWERRRERECLEIYAWTNALGVGEPLTPLEVELYRTAASDPELGSAMLDVFSRAKAPSEAFPLRRGALIAARAWRRAHGARRRAVARAAARELRRAAADRAARVRALAGPGTHGW
jgi:flavin-dependent dehydrogenase